MVLFSRARQVVGEIWKEVFLRRTLARGTHCGIGMFCLAEEGKQQINWVPEKHLPTSHVNDKNMVDKSIKITIFIIWEAL